MGKGDKKTKKGKISSGSFGVSRPHKKTETVAVKKEKPKAKEEKKSEKAETKTDSKKKEKK